jgi:hypothetical protein
MKTATPLAVVGYTVIVLGTALIDVAPRGDCGEYILMARGLARRGAPDFRDEDARWLARREKRLVVVARHLHEGLARQKQSVIGSVRTADGRYYSMHFWFYSLLAAPVLWLLEILRAPPLLALVAVNAAAASLAVVYLVRHFRGTWLALVAPGIFLLAGTTFYLRFTGAEMLSACGVLIATLAATRGEVGIGFLAAGVAATQNPTTAAVFGFVAFEAWRLRRLKRERGETVAPLLQSRTLAPAVVGLFLAALPYLFFQLNFGIPSLTGKYASDPGLISLERAWSFFFDLNQGMAFGLPGLFVGLGLALTLSVLGKSRWRTRTAATAALVLAMAIPTFAIHNWNAGSVVFMRYAYWAAMPLLALFLVLTARLPVRWGALAVTAFTVLQIGVLVLNGWRGASSRYLRHGWVARKVLWNAPAAYNPLPEIFVERTHGREIPVSETRPTVWPHAETPMKILTHERAGPAYEAECDDGSSRHPTSVTILADGWRYENGPFECGR